MLCGGAARGDKAIRTDLRVDTRQAFSSYRNQAGAATDVTFNLKDFRHMLALAEGLGCDVALYLEKSGSPLVVLPVVQSNDSKVGAQYVFKP